MKIHAKLLVRLLALATLLSAVPLASAYYDPGVQRWISRDPAGVRGGINLYTLVGNDSLARIDGLGLALLPRLPRWPLPTDPPFPWPLPNWHGATWCQRLNQCLTDCETAYQGRIKDCASLYLSDPCPFHNPILCAIDRAGSRVDFAICAGDVGVIRAVCRANCGARGASPWNW